MLGLHFCARAFSSCGKREPLFIVVRGPLTVAASLVVQHRLQTRRLSSCGSRAQLLRSMWDLPRPGLEPLSPALAGRLSTTAPPGKPTLYSFYLGKLKPKNEVLERLLVRPPGLCSYCFLSQDLSQHLHPLPKPCFLPDLPETPHMAPPLGKV